MLSGDQIKVPVWQVWYPSVLCAPATPTAMDEPRHRFSVKCCRLYGYSPLHLSHSGANRDRQFTYTGLSVFRSRQINSGSVVLNFSPPNSRQMICLKWKSVLSYLTRTLVQVWNHETADRLYCEEIDVGEVEPRAIASGLREHCTLEEMQGRLVLVVCNLRPARLAGFSSNGMVLAAKSSDGKVCTRDFLPRMCSCWCYIGGMHVRRGDAVGASICLEVHGWCVRLPASLMLC